jgi:hypothetical protein
MTHTQEKQERENDWERPDIGFTRLRISIIYFKYIQITVKKTCVKD